MTVNTRREWLAGALLASAACSRKPQSTSYDEPPIVIEDGGSLVLRCRFITKGSGGLYRSLLGANALSAFHVEAGGNLVTGPSFAGLTAIEIQLRSSARPLLVSTSPFTFDPQGHTFVNEIADSLGRERLQLPNANIDSFRVQHGNGTWSAINNAAAFKRSVLHLFNLRTG